MTDSSLRLHKMSRTAVRLIAGVVFIVATALTWATQDMGYTRDESFYFNYGESYQEWFVAVESASESADIHQVFDRDTVLRTWSGNFEHPPLMKVLFGFAWRHLGQKYRDINDLRAEDALLKVRVQVGKAAGYPAGAAVRLLAPLESGQSLRDDTRILARGKVVEREGDRVVAVFDAPADSASVVERCAVTRAHDVSTIPITPCQLVEDAGLQVLDEAGAMRLFGILSGGLAFMLTFLLGEAFFGWLVGLLAAVFFYFVPEHFFHAHMTCFDMPVVAAQLFVLYAFWRSLGDRRWALVTAIAWGTALLVKHNAFFIPVALVLWWLWCGRDRIGLDLRSRWRLTLPPMPLAFLLMLLIGIPMLFVFWPKLWFDPLRAVRDYFQFHLSHEHYMQYWFGEPLQNPPFPVSFPFLKSAFTYPESFVFFFLVGLAMLFPVHRFRTWMQSWRRPTEREKAAAFLTLNALIPVTVIALPSTPIFGGIKHWMTGTPLMAIIAAWAVFSLTRMLRIPRLGELAIGLLLSTYPIASSLAYAPVGTGYHNGLLAGGLEGAADKRLMRLFWGYTTYQSLGWVNAFAPRNARIFWQNTTHGSFDMYRRMGLVRHDIRYHPGPSGADIALIDAKQAFFELDQQTRKTFDLPAPLQVVAHDGVPFLHIYAHADKLPPEALEPLRWQAIWR